MDYTAVKTLFLLIGGHSLVDFALQNEFMAKYKDPGTWKALPKDSQIRFPTLWVYLLTAHCFQHGLVTYVITQNLTISSLETIVHGLIDYSKGRNWISFQIDQGLHVACKFIWIALLPYV